MKKTLVVAALFTLVAAPAFAQFGTIGKIAQGVSDVIITESEEIQIGTEVSAKLRDRYGVVQDKAIHRYVTLVGTVLAKASSRPNLPWQFIVLDTDGINAYAAPGGFIHITRGALSILKTEAELADVLGHEITHVTEKHAVNAVMKSKGIGKVGEALTKSDQLKQITDGVYKMIFEGEFNRNDEMKADKGGIAIAAAGGWAPTGLGDFLMRLAERNKNQPDRNGLFASHPDTQARLDGLTKEIKSQKLTAAALVAARYKTNVTYPPVPPPSGSAPAPASGGMGLSGLTSAGKDKSSGQTVSSGGSRGVNTERDAKGGPVKTAVTVSVTAAELADFKKGISG